MNGDGEMHCMLTILGEVALSPLEKSKMHIHAGQMYSRGLQIHFVSVNQQETWRKNIWGHSLCERVLSEQSNFEQ